MKVTRHLPILSGTPHGWEVSDWQTTIGKAILQSGGLPDALQAAVEHQDDFDTELEGPITLTDILISAKLLAEGARSGGPVSASSYPTLRRVGVSAGEKALEVMNEYVEEIQAIRASLGE
jgi:hypothetical protein